MEKRGRGGKQPSTAAPPQQPMTPGKERRPSMFEKEAVSEETRDEGQPLGCRAPAFVV